MADDRTLELLTQLRKACNDGGDHVFKVHGEFLATGILENYKYFSGSGRIILIFVDGHTIEVWPSDNLTVEALDNERKEGT